MMAPIVYVLCTLTSMLCAFLLLRTYRGSGSRLLLFSGLALVGVSLNNALLFLDVVIYPDSIDLLVIRKIPLVAGLGLLLYGLVWETSS
jgi:hypothetical protein